MAILFVGLLSPVWSFGQTQQAQSQVMTTTTPSSDTEQAPKLPDDQLDSLVAPIALYPDPLLAQTLAASTYPLEVIQLQQWMGRNKNLQGQALADAVAKQPWDPSVQSMVMFPDVITRMADNIQWTTDLGNAFLAQESDVMAAVQRMRAKAQGTGNLKTSAQTTVQTQTVPSGKQVITIQQANPDVVYVPSYDPTVVYGAPPPAYPYYPYTYPGYVPGTALAWGAGIALGAAAGGLGVVGTGIGGIVIGTAAASISTTIIISIATTILIATSVARDKVIGSIIRNTEETRPMGTGKQRTSSGAKVRVVLVMRKTWWAGGAVALLVPVDPVDRAV